MEENVVWILSCTWAQFSAFVSPAQLCRLLLSVEPIHTDLLEEEFSPSSEVGALETLLKFFPGKLEVYSIPFVVQVFPF